MGQIVDSIAEYIKLLKITIESFVVQYREDFLNTTILGLDILRVDDNIVKIK